MKILKRHYFSVAQPHFDAIKPLSSAAKVLYFTLKRIEHIYYESKGDFFFRALSDLENDSGLSKPTIIKAIKELSEAKVIYSWQGHFVDGNDKKSAKHITCFRVLDHEFG